MLICTNPIAYCNLLTAYFVYQMTFIDRLYLDAIILKVLIAMMRSTYTFCDRCILPKIVLKLKCNSFNVLHCYGGRS